MNNLVKDFKLGKDLKGYRQVVFELSDATEVLDEKGIVVGNSLQYDDEAIETNSYKKSETKVNKEENINKNNYEITKSIMQKRLDSLGIEDYTISLDNKTGRIYLQIPEDSKTDRVVSNITEKGNFEIKDSEDGTVHISGKNIKKVSTMYNTTETGTTVYLHIQLDKEGTEILKDISTNTYAKLPETSSEDENTASENTTDEDANESTKNETENKEEKDKSDDKSDEDKKDEENCTNCRSGTCSDCCGYIWCQTNSENESSG